MATIDKPTALSLAKKAVESYLSNQAYDSIGDAVADTIGHAPYNMEQVSRIAQATNQRLWNKLSSERDPAEVRFEPADPAKIMSAVGKRHETDPYPEDDMKEKEAVEKTAGVNLNLDVFPSPNELRDRFLSRNDVFEHVDKAAGKSTVKKLKKLWAARNSRRSGATAPHAKPPKKPKTGEDLLFRDNWDNVYNKVKRASGELKQRIHRCEERFSKALGRLNKVANDMMLLGTSRATIAGAIDQVVPEDTGAALLRYLEKNSRLNPELELQKTAAEAHFDQIYEDERDTDPIKDLIQQGRTEKEANEQCFDHTLELNKDHPLIKAALDAQKAREEAAVLDSALQRIRSLEKTAGGRALKSNAKVVL